MKSNETKIDALILCGGYGTRIRHLIDYGLPKFLAPVWDGRPIGVHLIEYLRRQTTVRYIALATNYGRERILAAGLDVDGIDLWHKHQGVISAVCHAATSRYQKTQLDTDPFLIVNGDTLFDFNIDDLTPGRRSVTYRATNVLTDEREHAGITFMTQRMLKHFQACDLGYFEWFPHIDVPDGHFLDIGTPEGFERAQEPWP